MPTLLDHGADVNAGDLQGRTALMFLTMFGTDDPVAKSVLREVLAKGADVRAKDAKGKTAEDWAVDYNRDQLAKQLRGLRESRRTDH